MTKFNNINELILPNTSYFFKQVHIAIATVEGMECFQNVFVTSCGPSLYDAHNFVVVFLKNSGQKVSYLLPI